MSLRFADVYFRYPPLGLFRTQPAAVLSSFSWQAPAGCTVILGPNGAGKSTLLSLGASALRPIKGRVCLGRLDSSSRRDLRTFRRAVGWLPQRMRPIPGLTSREQTAYAGWLKGMSRSSAWKAALVALERVDLGAEANRLTAELSGGQQRRVGLAQLMVHNSQVVLLDEPTAGLDPAQRSRFRDVLRDIATETPVVVSTHQVDDLTDLIQTVVVLDQGRIRFEGTVAAFMALAPEGAAHPEEAAYTILLGEQT